MKCITCFMGKIRKYFNMSFAEFFTQSASSRCASNEALPGVMGNRGIMSFISGEHVILGSREHRK